MEKNQRNAGRKPKVGGANVRISVRIEPELLTKVRTTGNMSKCINDALRVYFKNEDKQ